MPSVVFHDQEGTRRTEALTGESAMRAAVRGGVCGIVAQCGGASSCGTCHVYVAAEWADRLPPPDSLEDDLLEATAAPRQDTSRLSCQLVLHDELDGLELHVPDRQ